MSEHSPEGRGDERRTSEASTAKTAGVLTVDQIFREHGAFVWRALKRLGVAPSDVDDATQEVFVVVHRKLGEYEGRAQMRTWLYGIAVKVAAAQRRKSHVRREIATEEPVPYETASGDSPETAAAEREALVMLDRALDELDDDKRAVFVLYEVEGLEMPEVAEALACPVQTAYSRLHAARKDVEKAMKRAMLGKVTT